MKRLILVLTTILCAQAHAEDLFKKLECKMTYEETQYKDGKPIRQLTPVELTLGSYLNSPPTEYLQGSYFEKTQQAKIYFYMIDNEEQIAISLRASRNGESTDIFYGLMNPTHSLDVRLPAAPTTGPSWESISREMHIVCKPK